MKIYKAKTFKYVYPSEIEFEIMFDGILKVPKQIFRGELLSGMS